MTYEKKMKNDIKKVCCEYCGRYVALAYLANHQKQEICKARRKANCLDVLNELRDVLKILKDIFRFEDVQNILNQKKVINVEEEESCDSDSDTTTDTDESEESEESEEPNKCKNKVVVSKK